MVARAKTKTVKSIATFPSRDAVIGTTFDLIAEKGLGKTRLSDLARRLKVSLAELYRHYSSIEAIISLYIDQIDQDMIASQSGAADNDKRDVYFDMMMSRLDYMQNHRAGTVRWLRDLLKQPTLWPNVLRRWEQSLSLMLDIAGDSPLFPVKKLGLAAIYFLTIREWLDDDSVDMAKTMATLDGALGRAEAFGARFLTRKKAA